MLVRLLFLSFLLTWVSPALAAVELLVWQPTPESVRYILPRVAGESVQDAIRAYNSAESAPSAFDSSSPSAFDLPRGRDKSLFIANHEGDMTAEAPRARNFMSKVPATENFVLALGAAERLSEADRKLFNEKITERFAGLVVMGGDDVAPELYGQKVTHARGFDSARDRLEIDLIRTFVKAERGFLFGVCRGQQITSVALGYQLVQDIPAQLSSRLQHGNDVHPVELASTTNGHLKGLYQGQTSVPVYSWHHQSVIFRPGGPLELAATSADGVTEALEFKNRRGLLVQFHPEMSQAPPASRRILEVVSKQIERHVGSYSCGRVFRN